MLPAPHLWFLQNPANTIFRKMIFQTECSNTLACSEVVSNTIISCLQLGFILRFLSPRVPGTRLSGNIDVHPIGIFLNFVLCVIEYKKRKKG